MIDIFLVNCDRGVNNILLLSNNTVNLYPVIDNEMCLFGNIKYQRMAKTLKNKKSLKALKTSIINSPTKIKIDENEDVYLNAIVKLQKIQKLNPSIFKKAYNTLINLNLNKALEIAEKEQKHIFPKEYKNWINLIFNERKKQIQENLYLNNNNNNMEI